MSHTAFSQERTEIRKLRFYLARYAEAGSRLFNQCQDEIMRYEKLLTERRRNNLQRSKTAATKTIQPN